MEHENECFVCYEAKPLQRIEPCGHLLCEDCHQHLKTQCWRCRGEITPNAISKNEISDKEFLEGMECMILFYYDCNNYPQTFSDISLESCCEENMVLTYSLKTHESNNWAINFNVQSFNEDCGYDCLLMIVYSEKRVEFHFQK